MRVQGYFAMFAGLFVFTAQAVADYPEKPIALVQGFAAGGNGDVIARIIGGGLSKEFGQQVLVEARTGAGGNIASASVAKASADGYTLILMTGGHAVSAAIYKQLAFDPIEDFTWLSTVTTFPFVISVKSDSRIKDIADLVAIARGAPGALSYSSVGIGSTQHLSGELLQSMAKISLNHIPYRGGSGPVQDVLGGRVDLMFDSVTVTRVNVQAGRLRALGVTSAKSIPQLPDVPPVAATIPGYEVMSWTGLAAPKNLPDAIAKRLHAAMLKVLASPEIQTQLDATGGVPSPSNAPGDMKSFVTKQIMQWKKVVADAKIPQQ